MILYEYPLNERIRTYLRLERLIGQLGQLIPREQALDHHFALLSLFDILESIHRQDLKSDLLKDIQEQQQRLAAYRGNPDISERSLEAFLARLEHTRTELREQTQKPADTLARNDWLMSLRSRMIVPGGTCEFDLPSYHAWKHRSCSARQADLNRWTECLVPTAQAVGLLLHILRDSERRQMVMARSGHYQTNLPRNHQLQLLRIRLDKTQDIFPEISGNRLQLSIRMMQENEGGKLLRSSQDISFDLGFCA